MVNQGCRFTLSDDSHGPNDVAMHYHQLSVYLKSNNVRNIYTLIKDDNGKVQSIPTPDILSESFWNGYK